MKVSLTACWLSLLLLLSQLIVAPANAETFYVEGHGGVPLAVTVTGPEDGPEILFLHGIGMGAESFAPQMQSELAQRYRMVAFDLRGHGMSGKPHEAEAYTPREVWAEDVSRVMKATGLRRPVIVAWSYGTLVTADYFFLTQNNTVSGVVMVGAHGGIAPPSAPADPPDPQVMEQMARYYALRSSPALADQRQSIELLAPYLYEITEDGPSDDWKESARILGLLVPPYAQPHLRAHPMDNAALAPLLSHIPVLLVHGTKDFAVNPADVVAAKEAIPHLQVKTFVDAGHSPFAERPDAFNAMLAEFVDAAQSKHHDH
ncbi:alpha/beta fold hydrolase [Altererythrobacter sp. GH1-8]|uniref:alpha/beta fold hydrolase n=1 Tax=Altererythrobacter sp. GH1-8 TaxID=3349333 RepID=UPI00374D3379